MKKFLFYLLIAGNISGCSSKKEGDTQVILSVVIDNIDLSKKIKPEDLENIGPDKLRLLRNEIFARKGYTFNSSDLDKYFKKFDWYKPQFDEQQVESHLTDIDKFNASLIKEYENSLSIKDIPDKDGGGNLESGKASPEFEKYLTSIPLLELPFRSACDNNYKNQPNYDSELNKKYGPKGVYPYRRILHSNYVAILFLAPADILIPIVNTYTDRGELIDSYQIFTGYCGGEPGFYQSETFFIEDNLSIVKIDSVQTSEVDSDYNEIEGTSKLEVKKTTIVINDSGHFEEQ